MKDLKKMAFTFGIGSALALMISGNSGKSLLQSGMRFAKSSRKSPDPREEDEMRYI